jgi:hypothetical protein
MHVFIATEIYMHDPHMCIMERFAVSSYPSHSLIHSTQWLTLLCFTDCLQELVWKSVALMKGKTYGEIPIVFEEVQFQRATNIPKKGKYCGTVVRSFLTAVIQLGCLMCVSRQKTIVFCLISFILTSYPETAYSNTISECSSYVILSSLS